MSTPFDNEKEELLYRVFPNIASQLRGALGNIHSALGRIAPLEEREQNPQLDTNAALLYQSYYRILRVVNNLTDAAGLLDDGPLELENDDIVGFCRDLCRRCEDLAALRRHTLVFKSDRSGHIVAFNAAYLERLLLNLLSNAFKFTPEGGTVTVSVKVTSGAVELTVLDTGAGIPQALLPTLFDRYLHTDRLDPAPHGLGLGLPICRRIAADHGGSIMVTSTEGVGTRVVVSLPNRQMDTVRVKDLGFDYAGGFNHTLLELSDALPYTAFTHQNLD